MRRGQMFNRSTEALECRHSYEENNMSRNNCQSCGCVIDKVYKIGNMWLCADCADIKIERPCALCNEYDCKCVEDYDWYLKYLLEKR